MLYKYKKNISLTPSLRNSSYYKFLFFSNFLKLFIKNNFKNAYVNGKKTFFSKKKGLKKIFNYLTYNFSFLYYIIGFHFNCKKIFSISKNTFNNFYIFPRNQFSLPGNMVYKFYNNQLFLIYYLQSVCEWDRFSYIKYIGLYLSLIFFKEGWLINNLGLKYEKYSKSMGSYSKIISFSSKHVYYNIQLPSGLTIYFPNWWKAFLGINAGWGYNSRKRKHKYNINLSRSMVVRGVAKNPIDHPNGGRTKTKTPEKNPWNKVAKKSK